MLALLAAVTLAAAPDVAPPRVTRFALADTPRAFLREAPRCKGAARLQTGYEPALLYREQDRDAGLLRRLIELPEASVCLLGGGTAAAALTRADAPPNRR